MVRPGGHLHIPGFDAARPSDPPNSPALARIDGAATSGAARADAGDAANAAVVGNLRPDNFVTIRRARKP